MPDTTPEIDWEEALRTLLARPRMEQSRTAGGAGIRPVSGQMLGGRTAVPEGPEEISAEPQATPIREQRLPSINDDVLAQLIRRLNSVDPGMRQGRLQDLIAALFGRRSTPAARGSEEVASG